MKTKRIYFWKKVQSDHCTIVKSLKLHWNRIKNLNKLLEIEIYKTLKLKKLSDVFSIYF